MSNTSTPVCFNIMNTMSFVECYSVPSGDDDDDDDDDDDSSDNGDGDGTEHQN